MARVILTTVKRVLHRRPHDAAAGQTDSSRTVQWALPQAGWLGSLYAAAGAMAPEELVFIDDGFDRRQVPDLVPLRVGKVRLQGAATAAAAIGGRSRIVRRE